MYLSDLTLVVPTNAAFDSAVMMLTKVQINVSNTSTLPDPFLMDVDLMRLVVTNHLITQVGAVPQIILDALSDGTELKMTTWSDNEVIFTNDDGKVMLSQERHLGSYIRWDVVVVRHFSTKMSRPGHFNTEIKCT